MFAVVKNLKPYKDLCVIITSPKNKIEGGYTLDYTIFHEFLHVLLIANKVRLQNVKPIYWKLEEAIVGYIEYEDFIKRNIRRWRLWNWKK